MAESKPKHVLAHVTHEAVEQIGGIGAVLEGLMVSPMYKKHVKRSILVGPMATHMVSDPSHRLGEAGEVLYSSVDDIDTVGLAARFRPIEWAFNVAMVYGKRTYTRALDGRDGEAEVLLIDVFRYNADRLNVFKLRLWETFGLDSSRYESAWDYEEYTRLAEPAFYALQALMDEQDVCTVLAHEFMGMPAALAAIESGSDRFRTIFYAHECATARSIVEKHPGHDVMFYNVLDRAREEGKYVSDVFGDRSGELRHALISRAHLCDGIIAVGDRTRDEMKFLGAQFDDKPVDLVYNGLPIIKTTLKSKNKARADIAQYAESLVGFKPDVIMTHVTRPVISKGLWRDLQVCHTLDELLGAKDKTGALFILTSGGGVRRHQDVVDMERRYRWPRHHHEGYPDLVGPESDLNDHIEAFNADHPNVQVVLVNQFGWSKTRISDKLSEDASMDTLRMGADVEFGMATYEPFGISPLEPLACGAICVISTVCGCEGFVEATTKGAGADNVIAADYVTLPQAIQSIHDVKQIGEPQRSLLEQQASKRIAGQIMDRLPFTDEARKTLIDAGQKLAHEMGWDHVVQTGLLPLLDRIA